jgi:hypothetical protein
MNTTDKLIERINNGDRSEDLVRDLASHASILQMRMDAISVGLSPASVSMQCGGDCSKIPPNLAALILKCAEIASSPIEEP